MIIEDRKLKTKKPKIKLNLKKNLSLLLADYLFEVTGELHG